MTVALPYSRRRPVVLVVDDDAIVRARSRALLEGDADVLEAADGPSALEAARRQSIDLCLLDVRLPGLAGTEVLARLKALEHGPEVVLVTGLSTVRSAVEAMKLGAYDYLTKPVTPETLLDVARRALDTRLAHGLPRLAGGATSPLAGLDELIGASPAMQRVYEVVRHLADISASALILGESGTGKELVARAIHRLGARREAPFVAVNCGAIAPALLESELFGHERGAFTGAHARKPGKFELAHGGSLFLDEIGTLQLDLQPKLLRALQEREVERVGGVRAVKVDVRIVAATNADLPQAMAAGRFRQDLFYRLNVVPVALPPLRERREDIGPLARHFVTRYARRFGRPVTGIAPTAVQRLEGHAWPGNVRELENVIARSVALARDPVLEVADLPFELSRPPARSTPPRMGPTPPDRKRPCERPGGDERQSFFEAREAFERQLIRDALDRAGGNQTLAARELGLHRNTLLTKLHRFGLRADGRRAAGRGLEEASS